MTFELVVINRRPVLINGRLEVSYPSSTTFLSITFMLSAIPLVNKYISNKTAFNAIKIIFIIYMLFLVVERMLSGVHWLTDIMGSVLISVSLLMGYKYFGKYYVKQL